MKKTKNNSTGEPKRFRRNTRVKRLNLGVAPIDPPPVKSVICYQKSVQLSTSGAQTDFDFTVRNLCNMQSVCTTTTLAYPLAYAVRVRRVRVWAAVSQLAATTTVAIEWNAGATGFLMDGVSISDTSVSTTRPAHIDTRPPTESLGSWFQATLTGGSNILFSLTCPGGSLIRVDYDWVPNFTESNSSNSFVVASGSAGTLFAQNPSATMVVNVPLNSLF